MLTFRCKIWLETTGKAFGQGPYDLLNRIDRLGSLSKAAGEVNMSYSKAWKLVNKLEKRLGFKLIMREVGGSSGGGSCLTEEARDLMNRYNNFVQDSEKALSIIFKKHFGDQSIFLSSLFL